MIGNDNIPIKHAIEFELRFSLQADYFFFSKPKSTIWRASKLEKSSQTNEGPMGFIFVGTSIFTSIGELDSFLSSNTDSTSPPTLDNQILQVIFHLE